MKIKYPRTYHLPWSEGITSDDKMLPSIECLKGLKVVAPCGAKVRCGVLVR